MEIIIIGGSLLNIIICINYSDFNSLNSKIHIFEKIIIEIDFSYFL